jgi:hypothetical protein
VKRAASFALLALYALFTFGCGNSSSNGMMNNPAPAQVRVVQGVLDAGNLDALINGTTAPAASSPLATPPYFAVSGTSIHLEEVAAGTMGPSILDGTYPVAANTFTSLMVIGRETSGSIAAIALTDDHASPPAGQIKLRLVNGASTIGPVDVYTFNVGSVFPATPTVANLTFKSASAYLPLNAGNFQICMVPAGTSPVGGLVGVGAPQCLVNFIMQVAATDQNLTFAVFDPPILTGGNPGQFTVGESFKILTDLKK